MIHKRKERKISPTLLDKQTRGKRLKMARHMTGLTCDIIQAKYAIPAATVYSWENAKAGGLTLRGAKRILSAFHKEGLNCTVEWLLHGIGNSPQLSVSPTSENSFSVFNVSPAIYEPRAILKELMVFKDSHADAIDFKITDDGMMYYHIGDYIAGIQQPAEKIPALIGKDCVVQTEEGATHFRRIKPAKTPGLYHLVCTNPQTDLFTTALYDQKILSAAPVLWHRRSALFA